MMVVSVWVCGGEAVVAGVVVCGGGDLMVVCGVCVCVCGGGLGEGG